VLEVVHRSPQCFGLKRSRWWLDGLRQVISWLRSCSLVGVWRLLRRLGIHYKRGQSYLHSPDPAYDLKMAYIQAAQAQAARSATVEFLYQDELTYMRRPTVAQGYAQRGQPAPRAHLGYRANTRRRIAACLNMHTGHVVAWQRARFDHGTLLRFFQAVEAAYPQATRIFVALDNWPPHFHPTLVMALQPSKIMLLRLPTYAPWTNPVEKFWRLLYQDLLHLHPFVDDWEALQAAVQTWLDQWTEGSSDLLCYVGL
jgi:hypothetical protein